jgi:uncharacterized RDD family membrane protein YckC
MITQQPERTSAHPQPAPVTRAALESPPAAYTGPVYAPYAGFASRAAAMVVDLLIIGVVYVIAGVSWDFFQRTSGLTWLVDFLTARFAWLAPVLEFLSSPAFAVILLLVFSFVYFTFFFALGGATIGKYVMGLRVVTADGRRLRPRRAVLRALAYAPSALALYLGFLSVLTDDRRRGWHDKIARTVVIYRWRAEPVSAEIVNRTP